MEQIYIEKYEAKHKKQWDLFIASSVNGLFLHRRDFIEYHGDRFEDHSLLIFRKNKLVSLFPAHRDKDILLSHKGLSFGGLLWSHKMSIRIMHEIWQAILNYCHIIQVRQLFYKPVAEYYSLQATEEDIYILKKLGAQILEAIPSYVISLKNPAPYNENNRRKLQKMLEDGIQVQHSEDIEGFYSLLYQLLKSKYNSKPIHSLEELNILKNRFPENIKLYTIGPNHEIWAGVLFFIYRNTIKAQYIASSETGNSNYALTNLFDHIIRKGDEKKLWLDLGTCQNKDGSLNESLAFFKKGMGARVKLIREYLLAIH